MGGCCSWLVCASNEEERIGEPEVNERTHLIQAPVAADHRRNSDTINGISPTPAPVNSEQSALLRILNQTANEFIDVASADGLTMEQQDQKLRAKQYSQRFQQLSSNFVPLITNPTALPPTSVLVPLTVLQAPTLSRHELAQIRNYSDRLSAAVKSMKVVGKGQIVIAINTHI